MPEMSSNSMRNILSEFMLYICIFEQIPETIHILKKYIHTLYGNSAIMNY